MRSEAIFLSVYGSKAHPNMSTVIGFGPYPLASFADACERAMERLPAIANGRNPLVIGLQCLLAEVPG